MKLSGEERIAAPREQVWKALNDPAILKKAITGCKELVKTSDTQFSATVQAKVGPVKATFKGDVKLSKLKPPESYVISGQGKGGVAGFAKGNATVKLAEDGDATILTYEVDAQVGGKLAQIGSRLISSTAKKMAADFFKKFSKLAAAEPKRITKPAKKATRKSAKKATSKKTPAKKAAVKKASIAAKPSPKKESKSASSAKAEQPKFEQPASNPLMAFILAAIGAAIILFFFLLFG